MAGRNCSMSIMLP